VTEFLRLPDRVGPDALDVSDVVRRIEAHELVLDWIDVVDLDHETCRQLLSAFEGRYEQFRDALGISSMPDRIQPDIDWIMGEGPEPDRRPAVWMFLQGADSHYEDEHGRHYEYPPSIPNGRRVKVGDAVVVALPGKDAEDGRRVVATAVIGEIESVGDERLRAVYEDWVGIDPPLTFEELGGDPRPNKSNSINRIAPSFLAAVRARSAEPVHQLPEHEEAAAPVSVPSPCRLPDFDLASPAGVRDALHRLVALDLLGPACGPDEELLYDAPKTRYVVGTLAPKNDDFDPIGQDDSLDGAGEEGASEGAPEDSGVVSDTLFASSIGLTFGVAPGVEAIRVKASWGAYDRVASEVHFKEDGSQRMAWRREPRGGQRDLPLVPGLLEPFAPDSEAPDVLIKGVIREPDEHGISLVSLFLVNDQLVQRDERLKDRKWVFQPELRDRDRRAHRRSSNDAIESADLDPDSGDPEAEERAILGMTHRKHAEFAVGHGVGGARRYGRQSVGRRRRLGTGHLVRTPCCPGTTSRSPRPPTSRARRAVPRLRRLRVGHGRTRRSARDAELILLLRRIPETYTLDRRAARPARHRGPGLASHREPRRALGKAEHCSRPTGSKASTSWSDDRMPSRRSGSRTGPCAPSGCAASTHCVAGAARTSRSKTSRRPSRPTLAGVPARVRAAEHPDRHPDRPSETHPGGRFVRRPALVPHRRRQDRGLPRRGRLRHRHPPPPRGGRRPLRRRRRHVIMRYTLRLLTCSSSSAPPRWSAPWSTSAEEPAGVWGDEPFRIGLWVGQRPHAQLDQRREQVGQREQGNPAASSGRRQPLPAHQLPVVRQPSSKPDNVHVEVYKSSGRRPHVHALRDPLGVRVQQARSPSEGIPVLVVDEEIYRRLPTFLIATVDKFAQMPWNGRPPCCSARWTATASATAGSAPRLE
jgi:hypothetical protein